jgi:hypothetical protein
MSQTVLLTTAAPSLACSSFAQNPESFFSRGGTEGVEREIVKFNREFPSALVWSKSSNEHLVPQFAYGNMLLSALNKVDIEAKLCCRQEKKQIVNASAVVTSPIARHRVDVRNCQFQTQAKRRYKRSRPSRRSVVSISWVLAKSLRTNRASWKM